ncbi:unnamed protein product [Euphydryas editha]|uniref:Odorant receptor n=1 Tax=Euphydryas editha TaxID=104508 RepID=A0AAU9U2F6_EUPED|nr:unnamed protein product [Euphydryas editha]
MATQENEIVLFDETIKKVQAYLKIIGFQVDDRYRNRTFWERLRLSSMINISWVFIAVLGQLTWFKQNASSRNSFVQHTNTAPCVILCILSNIQSFYFIKYGRQVYHLIEAIKTLQSMLAGDATDESDVKFLKSQLNFLNIAVNGLVAIVLAGIFSFGISPLITIGKDYYNTGEVNLILPFLLAFPFDTNDVKFWLIAYLFEMWAALVATFSVLTPGFVRYACSTFIIFQFRVLHNDMEKIIPVDNNLGIQLKNEDIKGKFSNIIDRHGKLLACVDLMEFIYSESTLFNVVTSTLLICLTGFNVTIMQDLTLVVPFLQFLMMSLTQIYFLCYYGDMIMAYSMKVADAAYNSQWYRAETSIARDLMIISARAWKPSKMTALGFSDVNFKMFMRVNIYSSFIFLITSI